MIKSFRNQFGQMNMYMFNLRITVDTLHYDVDLHLGCFQILVLYVNGMWISIFLQLKILGVVQLTH